MKTLHITVIALLSITLLSSSVVYAEEMTEDGPIQNSTNHVYEDMTDDNETMEEWPIVVQLRAMIAELEAKIAELKEDKQNKNAKIAELRDKLKAKTNQTENQDEKLEAKLEKKNAKIAELEAALDNKDAKIQHLKEKVDRKIANKQEKVGTMKGQMDEMMTEDQKNKDTVLQQLLTAGHHQNSFEPTQLTNMLDIQQEDFPLPPYPTVEPNLFGCGTNTPAVFPKNVSLIAASLFSFDLHYNCNVLSQNLPTWKSLEYGIAEITDPNGITTLVESQYAGNWQSPWENQTYALVESGVYTWQITIDDHIEFTDPPNAVNFNGTLWCGNYREEPSCGKIPAEAYVVINRNDSSYYFSNEFVEIPSNEGYTTPIVFLNGTITVPEYSCDSTKFTCPDDSRWANLLQ